MGISTSPACYNDTAVVIIALVVSCSGIIINVIKKGTTGEVIHKEDGKTLMLFRLVIPAALIASLLLYFMRIGNYGASPLFCDAGYLLVCAGLLLRWVAVWSLGSAFRVKVSILKNQTLKTTGIYKNVRHPSYAGLLLYYMGIGMAMRNWVCLFILIIAPLAVVLKRIKVEEHVLQGYFGEEYGVYMSGTWRLLPYVY